MKNKIVVKTLQQSIIYVLIVLTLVFLHRFIYAEKNNILYLILALVSSAGVVFIYFFRRNIKMLKRRERDSMYYFFFYGIRVIIALTLLVGIWGIYAIIKNSECGECAIYKAIGMAIILIWACVFLSYFIWAIYYYNINIGLTEEEWDKIYEASESKRTGDFYSQEDIDSVPEENPYKKETFGLPAGTVRGMIAFTLLFGAIAMLIVSIGMKNELTQNTVFWDQYEFFKKAFLMMIAFYFGTRSLEYLNGKKTPKPSEKKPDELPTESVNNKPSPDSATQKTDETQQTVSGEEIDPMKTK